MSSEETTTVDVTSMKVTQLREELRKRNLSTAGNKPTLVQRLQEFIENEGQVTNGDEGEKQEDKEEESAAIAVEVDKEDVEGEGASEEPVAAEVEEQEEEEQQEIETEEGSNKEEEVMDEVVQTEASGEQQLEQGGHYLE